jgi:hypothetical protein
MKLFLVEYVIDCTPTIGGTATISSPHQLDTDPSRWLQLAEDMREYFDLQGKPAGAVGIRRVTPA